MHAGVDFQMDPDILPGFSEGSEALYIRDDRSHEREIHIMEILGKGVSYQEDTGFIHFSDFERFIVTIDDDIIEFPCSKDRGYLLDSMAICIGFQDWKYGRSWVDRSVEIEIREDYFSRNGDAVQCPERFPEVFSEETEQEIHRYMECIMDMYG